MLILSPDQMVTLFILVADNKTTIMAPLVRIAQPEIAGFLLRKKLLPKKQKLNRLLNYKIVVPNGVLNSGITSTV